MSKVEELQSTPSGHHINVRSQAGSQQYQQEEIKEDIELDLRNAVKCGFDQLLKYFLYLVLKEDSEEKKKLNELQAEIEELQSKRYYKQENGADGVGATPQNEAGSTTSGIPEIARQEAAADDAKDASPDEKWRVEERDGILDRLLKKVLKAVLPIANKKEIKDSLNDFAKGFKGHETKRYGPYVILCNKILDESKTAFEDLPVRGADALNIRFQRNDPSPITSRFEGTNVDINRNPDVAISSEAALFHLNGGVEPKYTKRPPKSLPWPIIFSLIEFKIHNGKNPEGVPSNVMSRVFEFQDDPVSEASHTELLGYDEVTEEDTGDNAQSATGSKRSHDAASLGTGEGRSSAKKARTPTDTPSGTLSGSKAKSTTSAPMQEVTADRQTQKAIKGRVQSASYALEMLSYSAGVHHAINLLFTDGIFWVWYYDRQGIIQSTGINVFEDFPRFIVLLLAFQRFSLEDWGVIRSLNPEAVHEHGKPPPLRKDDDQQQQQQRPKKRTKKRAVPKNTEEDSAPLVVINLQEDLENLKDFGKFWRGRGNDHVVNLSEVELNMKEFLSNQPHCLAGRATAVVPAVGRSDQVGTADIPMVCKVYHPEVQRRHEGLTMQVIYDIAENDELKSQQISEQAKVGKSDMFKHLPKFYFHGDVKRTTTQRVRSMVNRRWKGHRTMRIIGMKQLRKITTILGWEFVRAWLEGVVCHAFLWKNFIEHGDPSVSNLMYDPETKSGVLTDFDLSLLQWEPRVFGTDRTGTVPFMALDLLTKAYWNGEIKRYYHHELESFIWILPYVFLLYQDGKRQRSPLIDSWRTSSYDICCEKKGHFYSRLLQEAKSAVQSDFEDCWLLASHLCLALHTFHLHQEKRILIGTEQNPFVKHPAPSSTSSTSYQVQDSEELWNTFTATVKLLEGLEEPAFKTLVDRLEYYKPSFDPPTPSTQAKLREQYHPILHPPQTEPTNFTARQ